MKNPDLPVPEYDGRTSFTWVRWSVTVPGRGTYCGYADASTLGRAPGTVPGSQVWNDAADVGFLVRGAKGTRLFTLVEELVCADERGLRGWRYSDGLGSEIVIHND